MAGNNLRAPLFVVLKSYARQSAPTDGAGKGTVVGSPNAFATSKQNSDAHGMFYQSGRKDPFAFATSSEKWGVNTWQAGKYPVKIYTIDGVLIYQDYNGGDNKDKQPVGGIIYSSIVATSMLGTIKNPITFYWTGSAFISQGGHTRSLWDYYWTSYSRGTDGIHGNTKKHNDYLDGYISQRVKSIYDPCPYGFQVPANGIYNQFASNLGWITWSYIGGAQWLLDGKSIWLLGLGFRSSHLCDAGYWCFYKLNVPSSQTAGYEIVFACGKEVYLNKTDRSQSEGASVRCIVFVIMLFRI